MTKLESQESTKGIECSSTLASDLWNSGDIKSSNGVTAKNAKTVTIETLPALQLNSESVGRSECSSIFEPLSHAMPPDYSVIPITDRMNLPEKLHRVTSATASLSELQQVLQLESKKLNRMLEQLSRKFDTHTAKEEDLAKAKELFKLKNALDHMYDRAKHHEPHDPALAQSKEHAKKFLEEDLLPEKLKSLKEHGLTVPPELNGHEISFQQAIVAIASADRRISECVIRRNIENKANNLPKEWLDKRTLSDDEWALKANAMIALTAQTKLLIRMANGIQSIAPDFESRLPKGSYVEQDSNGKITNIHLVLPKNLDESEKVDSERIEELQKWLSTEGTRISDSIKEWNENQYSTVEQSRSNSKVFLDREGIIVPSISDGSAASESAIQHDYNLVSKDYQIKTENGKIIVEEQLQLKEVPVYGWQNSFAFNVGKPLIKTQSYDPQQLVAVMNGSEMKLIHASELSRELVLQRRWQTAGHIASGAMDLGLTLSGGMEAYGALRLGLKAVSAFAAAKSVGHLALGLTGLFENNAGASEAYPALTSAMTRARQGAFMTMIARDALFSCKSVATYAGLLKASGTEITSAPSQLAEYLHQSKILDASKFTSETGLGMTLGLQIKELLDHLNASRHPNVKLRFKQVQELFDSCQK